MAKDETGRQSRKSNPSIVSRQPKPKPRWQERLLPTMNGLLIGLTIFFFVTTFAQMVYLHWSILQSPPVKINQAGADILFANAVTFEDRLNARELEVKSDMEAYVVTQRYHHASVLLMSGLWLRYLGFITGMILALVGASFVLGKLREPSQKLEGKFSGIDISLRTTSPGIILAFLGVVLMFATIVDNDPYEVKDASIYLSPISSINAIEATIAPTLPSLDKIQGTSIP